MTFFALSPSRLLGAVLTVGMLGSAAHAQTFSLPADYWNRFGSIEGAFDSTASKYGVRYFPLPIKYDLRVIFVSHANYEEYGLYTRYKDTDFKIGNLDGGQKGIRTLEMNHNPWQGIQFHSKFQWSSVKGEYFANYVEAGYAKALPIKQVPGLNVRLFGALGYGALGVGNSPYTHVEVWAGKNFDNLIKNDATNTHINLNLAGTLRNYYFISPSKTFTSLETNIDLRGQIINRVNGYARNWQRYVFDNDNAGKNNPYQIADGRDHQTFAGVNYLLDYGFGPVNLHSVQYDYTHYWYDLTNAVNRNELGATFRLNVAQPLRLDLTPGYDFYWGGASLTGAALVRLPEAKTAFGPSVKYNWLPNGNHRWSVGVVVTDKGN